MSNPELVVDAMKSGEHIIEVSTEDEPSRGLIVVQSDLNIREEETRDYRDVETSRAPNPCREIIPFANRGLSPFQVVMDPALRRREVGQFSAGLPRFSTIETISLSKYQGYPFLSDMDQGLRIITELYRRVEQLERYINESREGNGNPRFQLINAAQQQLLLLPPPAAAAAAAVAEGGACIINPEEQRWYCWWTLLVFPLALLSSIFYPVFYGFFSDFSNRFIHIVSWIDIFVSFTFFVDFVFQFCVSYRDRQTGCMVRAHIHIAFRYLKSYFILGLLSCVPWDFISESQERSVIVSYLSWSRVARVANVIKCLHVMQDNNRINKKFARAVKVVVIQLLYTHIVACIFYFLATTDKAGKTWIGSLTMGDYNYSNFMDIDLARRYVTSLYFITVTWTTVGFGDIHAIGAREMIFVIVFLSINGFLVAYLSRDISALMENNWSRRRCTVFHCQPWDYRDNRIQGHTMWVASTMNGLIEEAARRANIPETASYRIFSEVGGAIIGVDIIENGQLLFLVADTP